mmetsp:Transcript_20323/g.35083  ORF Transcript_20323/g.35083 Transcript_20323/m.35083 type:complete len:308 (+) Transcript_20323:225-1148(+)
MFLSHFLLRNVAQRNHEKMGSVHNTYRDKEEGREKNKTLQCKARSTHQKLILHLRSRLHHIKLAILVATLDILRVAAHSLFHDLANLAYPNHDRLAQIIVKHERLLGIVQFHLAVGFQGNRVMETCTGKTFKIFRVAVRAEDKLAPLERKLLGWIRLDGRVLQITLAHHKAKRLTRGIGHQRLTQTNDNFSVNLIAVARNRIVCVDHKGIVGIDDLLAQDGHIHIFCVHVHLAASKMGTLVPGTCPNSLDSFPSVRQGLVNIVALQFIQHTTKCGGKAVGHLQLHDNFTQHGAKRYVGWFRLVNLGS